MSFTYTYIYGILTVIITNFICSFLHLTLPICVHRFGDIPENIDILVTHGPAYGRLDAVILGDAHPRAGKGLGLLKEERWGSKVRVLTYIFICICMY